MSGPNEKKLRQELAEARSMQELEQQRYGRPFRSTLEQVARYLYRLGEPEARDYLLHVIESEGTDSTLAGLFYRMLGDSERSRRAFEQSYENFRVRLDEDNYMSVAATAEAAFLAGRYGESERLATRYRELDPNPGLRIHTVGKLSRARRTGDPRLAEEAAEEFAEMIRKSRVKVSDTGNVNLWDWYELALQTRAESEGESTPTVGKDVGTETPDGTAGTGTPDLAGRDLRGEDLRGASLARSNLRGANLALQSMDESDLSGADLQDADLSEADLSLAVLVDADLRGANLSKAELIETNLQGADLRGAKLAGAELQDPDFSGADLTGVDLNGLDLRGAEFRQARLRGTNLSEADLSHADLTGADLTGADLRGAKLEAANLEGAIMDDVIR